MSTVVAELTAQVCWLGLRVGICQMRRVDSNSGSGHDDGRINIHALVLPHLDYCNSVLYGLPTSMIRRLQSVQNATGRLIFGIRRSEHISPAPSLAAHP